jgi:hypothetical protein
VIASDVSLWWPTQANAIARVAKARAAIGIVSATAEAKKRPELVLYVQEPLNPAAVCRKNALDLP